MSICFLFVLDFSWMSSNLWQKMYLWTKISTLLCVCFRFSSAVYKRIIRYLFILPLFRWPIWWYRGYQRIGAFALQRAKIEYLDKRCIWEQCFVRTVFAEKKWTTENFWTIKGTFRDPPKWTPNLEWIPAPNCVLTFLEHHQST